MYTNREDLHVESYSYFVGVCYTKNSEDLKCLLFGYNGISTVMNTPQTWVSMFQCPYLNTFNAIDRNFPKEGTSLRESCLIHDAHLVTEGRLSKLLGKN